MCRCLLPVFRINVPERGSSILISVLLVWQNKKVPLSYWKSSYILTNDRKQERISRIWFLSDCLSGVQIIPFYDHHTAAWRRCPRSLPTRWSWPWTWCWRSYGRPSVPSSGSGNYLTAGCPPAVWLPTYKENQVSTSDKRVFLNFFKLSKLQSSL